jgi:hypothetical protein
MQNSDEQRVLDLIQARMLAGRRQYGPLDLATDGRDFRVETLEELLDAIVYLACWLVKLRAAPNAGGHVLPKDPVAAVDAWWKQARPDEDEL